MGTTRELICDALDDRSTPFLFHSGQPLPTKYGGMPVVDKPSKMADLVDAVRLLSTAVPARDETARPS